MDLASKIFVLFTNMNFIYIIIHSGWSLAWIFMNRVRTGLKSTWIYRTVLKSPWKLNLPWKVFEKHSKALKSPWILPFTGAFNSVLGDLNQYKIVVPLFGAAFLETIFFLLFFRDHFYLWETMTHIRMIFKHLCLSGMHGIIQSKTTWFWGYILLPLLCSMSLISPNFDVKSIIFSQFWPGAFSQNCWKKPC